MIYAHRPITSPTPIVAISACPTSGVARTFEHIDKNSGFHMQWLLTKLWLTFGAVIRPTPTDF
jgi:hypothetical protein